MGIEQILLAFHEEGSQIKPLAGWVNLQGTYRYPVESLNTNLTVEQRCNKHVSIQHKESSQHLVSPFSTRCGAGGSAEPPLSLLAVPSPPEIDCEMISSTFPVSDFSNGS